MKDKILKEVIEWYNNQSDKPDQLTDEFITVVIDKTADAIIEKIKTEFKTEFEKGNLQHPFIISDEYYLYLKLKEIKDDITKKEK